MSVTTSELGLYIAICYEPEDLEGQGLVDVTHTWLSGITNPEVTARKEDIEPKFVPPVRQPKDDERRKLTGLDLFTLIRLAFACLLGDLLSVCYCYCLNFAASL